MGASWHVALLHPHESFLGEPRPAPLVWSLPSWLCWSTSLEPGAAASEGSFSDRADTVQVAQIGLTGT